MFHSIIRESELDTAEKSFYKYAQERIDARD